MIAGTQIGGYRLVAQIGKGGFGEVWVAEHEMLGRRAAIKLLNASVSGDPSVVMRFFNEAKAATAISDPGIVQVFDFGRQADGSAYIVMELLDGEPLDRRLRARGVLPIGEALRIVHQVASSLGAAHRHGIVHRDLKPENIFVVRDPAVAGGERAKILDFGIAKLSPEWEGGSQTQSTALLGTPAYMSPEQCRGAGQVDQRSDIYSAGCVLFHLITGRPVFAAQGLGELISQHIASTPPRAASLVPAMSPAVDALIAQCLAKDPADRFASGAALADAIAAVLARGEFTTGAPVPSALAVVVGNATTLGASVGSRPAPAPRRRKLGLGLGLGLAGLVGGGAIVVFATRPADRPLPVAVQSRPAPVAQVELAIVDAGDPRPHAAEAQLANTLLGFLTWAAGHPGCPTMAELGGDGVDPWGHPLVITCTDQPADQMIGVVSLGPDGAVGTADDVQSWRLDPEITRRIHGPRRVATAVVAVARPTPTPTPTPTPRPAPTPTPSEAETADEANERGKKAMFSGQFSEALDGFLAAIKLSPQAKYMFNACTTLHQLGRFAEAIAMCKDAAKHAPPDALAKKIQKLLELSEQRRQAARP